jgi:hypothetical protein
MEAVSPYMAEASRRHVVEHFELIGELRRVASQVKASMVGNDGRNAGAYVLQVLSLAAVATPEA